MNRVTDLNKGDLSSAQEIGELECVINNLQTRIAALERERDRLRELFAPIMIGGNHLALWIGEDHPPYTATDEEAISHFGSTMGLDVWRCWKIIMETRQALGGKEE